MRCISDGRTLNTGEGIQADEQKRERERERGRESTRPSPIELDLLDPRPFIFRLPPLCPFYFSATYVRTRNKEEKGAAFDLLLPGLLLTPAVLPLSSPTVHIY
jgi:hypothetical protein